jgi:beta-lactamase regulating signal transducer with metallopeptidase domain
MSAFTQLAWTQFWQTSAVALAAGFAAWASCRRRPHLAYLLWIVVILKCLTPPIWSSPTGLFSWALVSPSAAESFEAPAAITTIDAGPARPDAAAALLPMSQQTVSTREANVAPTSPWSIAVTAVGIVWLSGVLGCAGFVLVSFSRVWSRLRCSALPLEPKWLAQFDACADRLALRRRVRLVVTSQPIGPAVFGFVRPVVVLPHSLVTRRSQIELAPILSHELIHIRRADPLVAVVQVFAQCLWWFHPLIWWANRQASRERERACDEEVLAELKLDPAAYGQSLLHILRMKRSLQPVLAFPGVRPVEVTTRRLAHIMQAEPRFHVRTPRWQWAVAFVAATVALPGAGLAFPPKQGPEAPPKSADQPPFVREKKEEAGGPNFVVIPLRTELQRKLIAHGKPVHALIEINGYALVGKRGDELMKTIDAAALRKSLAAIKAGNQNASVAFEIEYFGQASEEVLEFARTHNKSFADLSAKDDKAFEQACHLLANEAHLPLAIRVTQGHFNDSRFSWQNTLSALRTIDLPKETAEESSVAEGEVIAYPVRTKITRLLFDGATNPVPRGPDCVVYIMRPVKTSDQPLVAPDLRASIQRTVSKLELPSKQSINFRLIPATGDQQNLDAIVQRFVGKGHEGERLAELLGFKNFVTTF